MFDGCNVVCLDLETARSASDLATGWKDKRALGLSIGGYYDYKDGLVHWFDAHTLYDTMVALVKDQPLLVSFNGYTFDFALMRAILRFDDTQPAPIKDRMRLCDEFKVLAAQGYDLLQEVFKSAGTSYERDLNSLDALLKANGLPPKTGHGALAPKLWQAGKYAEVLNYCQWDILGLKALVEQVAQNCGTLQRRTGPIQVRWLAQALPTYAVEGPPPVEIVDPQPPQDYTKAFGILGDPPAQGALLLGIDAREETLR